MSEVSTYELSVQCMYENSINIDLTVSVLHYKMWSVKHVYYKTMTFSVKKAKTFTWIINHLKSNIAPEHLNAVPCNVDGFVQCSRIHR